LAAGQAFEFGYAQVQAFDFLEGYQVYFPKGF